MKLVCNLQDYEIGLLLLDLSEVEQPGGSLLMQFPLIDHLLRLAGHAHKLCGPNNVGC